MKQDKASARILIIEDEALVAESLLRLLEDQYVVETAGTAEEGIARVQANDFDVVITDLQMPGLSGFEVITSLHPLRPHVPIILITGHHTTDTAIEAIKLGAYDYVLKPITNPPEFLALIAKAVASNALSSKSVAGRPNTMVPEAMIGRSQAMQNVCKEIGRVAARPVTVLIRGETGTGKELVARAVYQYSERVDQPLVVVNCVAIPEALLESELFGHEQGSFTGAQSRRIGKFEQADKGTIFLDEIGDISLTMQAKLLRVLQEKAIQRVGGKETLSVDVRVLAATHCGLEQAVEAKTFREDLYYRLNDAVIRLPPLRERRDDIPDLVSYFLNQQAGAGSGTAAPKLRITAEAVHMLEHHSWPGNVRELKNVVHKALLLASGYVIDCDTVRQVLEQSHISGTETKRTLQACVSNLLDKVEQEAGANVGAVLTEWVERELYGQAIQLAKGDQTKVARWLGVSRPTVRERLLRFGLHPAGVPDSAG
jgi:DNA-binding NtrC family response regulator